MKGFEKKMSLVNHPQWADNIWHFSGIAAIHSQKKKKKTSNIWIYVIDSANLIQ